VSKHDAGHRLVPVQTQIARHDRATIQAIADQDAKPLAVTLRELIEEALDVRRVNALESEPA
jgi:hypothetical protein